MHFIILPCTYVIATVSPIVSTISIYIISYKFSYIIRAIGPFEKPLSTFDSLDVSTFEAAAVRPILLPYTLLFVIFPLSHVLGTISMCISSESI